MNLLNTMNMEELKIDIREQISKINLAFTNYWGRLFLDGLLSEDLEKLDRLLKKTTKLFKFNIIVSIPLSALLTIFSMLKFFDFIDFGNMNKAGLAILFTVVFLTNTYRSYKVKVNLENKIYLLGLLDKIGRN